MEMREYIEAIAESCRKLIISKPATKQEEYRKIIVQKKEDLFPDGKIYGQAGIS